MQGNGWQNVTTRRYPVINPPLAAQDPMMKQQQIQALVDSLAALAGTDRLFNPYAPPGDAHADIRRENLRRYLTDLLPFEPETLLLAEAPGYRGCRLTGIPVTSERIMLNGVDKWGLFGEGYRATSDNPDGVAEMTATILWNALVEHVDVPPVIWNTVPLHPHKPGKPQSNRTPLVGEIQLGAPIIEEVIALYGITKILGVGKKAQRILAELGHDYIPLRHPSQGGKADFINGLVDAGRSG